jgi:hypothetical protein
MLIEVWVITSLEDPMPPLAQRSLNEKGLPLLSRSFPLCPVHCMRSLKAFLIQR